MGIARNLYCSYKEYLLSAIPMKIIARYNRISFVILRSKNVESRRITQESTGSGAQSRRAKFKLEVATYFGKGCDLIVTFSLQFDGDVGLLHP